MKASLMLGFALVTTGIEGAEISYNPQDWPKRTLELSERGTLKDVFDSGIRPYRFPGLESMVLQFKHVRLTPVTPERRRLPEVDVEWADVSAKLSGLGKILTYSPKLSLEAAKEEMMQWLEHIDRTEGELNRFLEIVGEDFLRYDDRNMGKAPEGFYGSWIGENKETYTVWLQKCYHPQTPLRFCFRVYWVNARTTAERRQFYEIPIPPPEGYEHISMEAPKNFGPDSMADIRKSRGEDIGDGTGPIFKFRDGDDGSRAGPVETAQQPVRPASRLGWLLLVFAALLGAGSLVIWTRRTKETS